MKATFERAYDSSSAGAAAVGSGRKAFPHLGHFTEAVGRRDDFILAEHAGQMKR